jgi:hypothetical protein
MSEEFLTMLGKIRSFVRDENAAVAFETVLMTPILVWSYVGTFVFFDAYRVYNTSVKTSYMVSDMLSRETNWVYPADIQGMADVINTIIRGSDEVEMRATQIGMVSGNYQVDWSWGVNGASRLFDANLPAIADRLPLMADGERVILVETFVDYEAPFNVGPDRDQLRELLARASTRGAGAVRSRWWPSS